MPIIDKQVCSTKAQELLDGISRATLARYRSDPRLNFPKAIERRGRLYFYERELLEWKASRPRVVTLPPRRRRAARPSDLLNQKAA